MKKIFSKLCLAVIIPIFMIVVTSCGPGDEDTHPIYIKARKEKENQHYEKAAEDYEKYLLINPTSAKAHYKVAEVYNDNLNDPFMAIYHFKQYLKYNPKAYNRNPVEVWTTNAEIRFADKIYAERPGHGVSKDEVNKLKEYNEKYRAYLIKLKNQNAALLKQLKNGGGHRAYRSSGSSVSISPSTNVYVVKSGDTLSKISKKVYGSSKYHTKIFEANRDQLKSESRLKLGQKLRIPQIGGKTTTNSSNDELKNMDSPGIISD